MIAKDHPRQISLLFPKSLIDDALEKSENSYIILGKYNILNRSVGIFAADSLCSVKSLHSLDFCNSTKVIGIFKFSSRNMGLKSDFDSFNFQDISKPLSDFVFTAVSDIGTECNEVYLKISSINDCNFNLVTTDKVNIIIFSGQRTQIINLSKMLNSANQFLDNAIYSIENNLKIDDYIASVDQVDEQVDYDSLFEHYKTIMDNYDFKYLDTFSAFNANQSNGFDPFFLQIFRYLLFYSLTLLSFSSSFIWSCVSNFPFIQTLIQKNICATISQAAYRIKNQRNWIILNHILKHSRVKLNKKLHNSLRLLFLSSITTVTVDYLLGVLFAFGVDTFSRELVILMEKSFFYIYHDAIHTQVKWLMSFPAGFKLNQNLTTVMGNLTLAALKFWCDLTSQHFSDLNHNMIFLIKFVSVTCGMSVSVALIWDILNIYSFLLFFIYTIMAKLYNLNLKAIKTFFYIFRGLKSNIFSNIDHNSHYSEQLLIGTILFTIFVLILPTITAFYINFLFIWSCVYIALVLLFFTISTINTFPFYLISMQAIAPNTFSSGIFIEKFLHNTNNQLIIVFSHKNLNIKSICRPFSDSLSHLFRVHLNIIQIIKSILSGNILHILNLQGSKIHHFKSTFATFGSNEKSSENNDCSIKSKNYLKDENFYHYIFDNVTPTQLYNLK
ncbi:GPI1 PIG-Q like N-acetylglucosaminyl-phosphatidylinositol transferase involved in GIP anchor biosynthesis [Cryptosporidium sp. chipmunk genotype I]|uniref:GPI1 PIG-Q like N-acetylglucosaminyl-phosphatidylinositol transferase involved in GIP anchor biosynthesis n=1 Tax=Cryptosporidium sp. chipmunk genotype I TaxID=1280935 RepID=UPI00351A57F5|nr:GPI1 PIG-Q like N-acetylglucosaminyl-phosphatidylinositol transferase involved in GIP anchor biosynthesis [Cryptosporidium sp. chipmunk genotype I]